MKKHLPFPPLAMSGTPNARALAQRSCRFAPGWKSFRFFCLPLIALMAFCISANAQWNTTPVNQGAGAGCTGTNFPGTSIPNNRGLISTSPILVHSPTGPITTGTSIYSTIGVPSNLCINNWYAPYANNLYGFAVNTSSDRCFFGMRDLTNNHPESVIAWGDDPDGVWGGPDLFTFEFHQFTGSNQQSTATTAMTLFPTSVGTVNVGIGTKSPLSQLHTTGDVRFTGLLSGQTTNSNSANYVSNFVGQDGNGVLYKVPAATFSGPAYTGSQGIALNGTDFQLGSACGLPAASSFTSSRQISLAGNNLSFNTSGSGKLYMGNSSCPTLSSRLEISSAGLANVTNSYTLNAPSPSGLRFSDLRANMPAIPPIDNLSTPSGVLSLDGDGDVIWVKSGWQTNGNTIGVNDYFGTNNAADIVVATTGVEMARFTQGRNFELGDPPVAYAPLFAPVFPNMVKNSSAYCGAFGSNNVIDKTFASLCLGGNNNMASTSSGGSSANLAVGDGHSLTNTSRSWTVGEANNLQASANVSVCGNANDIRNSLHCEVSGRLNSLDACNYSAVAGIQNQLVTQNAAFAAGENNMIQSPPAINGMSNVALGQLNRIINAQRSGAFGNNNNIGNSTRCFTIGNAAIIGSSSVESFALGNSVGATGTGVHAYGEQISNTADHSIAMGFNNIRTMTVTQDGVGIMVSNASNYIPAHHLEVDADPGATPGVKSNVAFVNLPAAKNQLPAVLIDPSNGELFMSNQTYARPGHTDNGFDGNVVITDSRTTDNPVPVSDALSLLGRLSPKKYTVNGSVYPSLNLPQGQESYGIIAQELKKVLPALVQDVSTTDSTGKDAVALGANYSELIPILIQAVKDQQAQIREQQKNIAALNARLSETAARQQVQDGAVAHLDVLLTNNDLALIDQNQPNPFNRETIIPYYLPQSVRTATVQFADMEGRIIKKLDISARGKGVLNVYCPELNAGIYTYTLIADGRTIATKKMEILK